MSISITIIIVIITVLASLAAFNNADLKYRMMMHPFGVSHNKEYQRIFTHGFIHADYMHLFFNMFVLYGFGENIEQTFRNEAVFNMHFPTLEFWGAGNGLGFFIVLYLGGIIFATLPSLRKHKDNPNYYSLGASGAVSSVLIAFILMFPLAPLNFIFLPGIDIPAWLMGILFFVYESYMNKKGRTGIAHDAHIYGAIWGLLLMLVIKPQFYGHFIQEILSYFTG